MAGDKQPRWRLNLAQQFMLASLIVLVVGMAGIGAWVARQIEDGVVQRSAATTALYVDSLVAPPLQELAESDALSSEAKGRLEWLFADTPLGREVRLFQVWDPDGKVVFSTVPGLVGQELQVDPDYGEALAGRVQAHIGHAEGGDLLPASDKSPDLLEIYSPVRNRGTNEVIAVAEFYYAIDDLREEIAKAQRQSWLIVGLATLAIYLALAEFVRRASNTIERQQRELATQVATLRGLLHQNEELHQRARGAAARTVALNERFLRRISADLHDGPAQDISLALLRLDTVAAQYSGGSVATGVDVEQEIAVIQGTLQRALQELRTTSSGILLPQLSALSLGGTIDHVARAHRRRTGYAPEVKLSALPEQAPLATKIAVYRIIQEALSNAARHAPGASVTIGAESDGTMLRIEIVDQGPGFDPANQNGNQERLGLVGMRERIESLGGTLTIASAPGVGTRLTAVLPIAAGDAGD